MVRRESRRSRYRNQCAGLARKRRLIATSGTLPTKGPLFVMLLLGTIVLVTALTFFPALSLGPIAEHFLMRSGVLY